MLLNIYIKVKYVLSLRLSGKSIKSNARSVEATGFY